MKQNRRRILAIAAGGLIVLGLSSCTSSHDVNVAAAKKRYHDIRARLMLPLAVQQFEAGDLDEAERTVTEALLIDPANARFHVLGGRIAIERRRLERALLWLNLAIELDPKLPMAHYYRGIVFQRWSKFEDALGCFDQAYELEPDQVAFLLARAEMLVARQQGALAIELLTSKLTYFEHHAGLQAAIGQIYAMQGNYDQAAQHLEQAQLLAPDDLQLVEMLAMVQLKATQPRKAVRHLRRLTADPDYVTRKDLKRALAQSLLQSGQRREAQSIYRRLTRQDPADADAWIKLGEIAWMNHDTAGALTAAQRVTSIDAQRPEGYMLAGLVWQERDRLDKAGRYFAQAAQVSGDDSPGATPWLLHGIALQRSGHEQAAAAAYQQAIRRRPDDRRARELLARISREE